MDWGLPEDSILSNDEYDEMYDAACDSTAFSALKQLVEDNEMRVDDAPESIGWLHTVGLVQKRIDSGVDGSTTYYAPTSLGRRIVELGPDAGVRELAEEEWVFKETYGR